MANHIWLRGMDCAVSNGEMAVLLTALGLSGSRLAGTEEERRLIVWLMEHDQSVLGLGAVGFSLSELPWERERLAEGQDFLLRTIGGCQSPSRVGEPGLPARQGPVGGLAGLPGGDGHGPFPRGYSGWSRCSVAGGGGARRPCEK